MREPILAFWEGDAMAATPVAELHPAGGALVDAWEGDIEIAVAEFAGGASVFWDHGARGSGKGVKREGRGGNVLRRAEPCRKRPLPVSGVP